MEIQVGDILVMKKPHPCGASRWLVLRTGADLRLRCSGLVIARALCAHGNLADP